MNSIVIVLKVIVSLSILNVWLLRFGKATPWRGGEAKTMKEEFESYGLPQWFMYLIGGAKVLLALLLLFSIFYNELESIGAYGIATLMLGAIIMHLKIKDPLLKSVPAITFLVLSIAITLL